MNTAISWQFITTTMRKWRQFNWQFDDGGAMMAKSRWGHVTTMTTTTCRRRQRQRRDNDDDDDNVTTWRRDDVMTWRRDDVMMWRQWRRCDDATTTWRCDDDNNNDNVTMTRRWFDDNDGSWNKIYALQTQTIVWISEFLKIFLH